MRIEAKVSGEDVKNIMGRHIATNLGLATSDVNVTISEGSQPLPSFPLWEAIQVVQRIPEYRGSGKITAIKALRDFSMQNGTRQIMGLADAKYFVEALA